MSRFKVGYEYEHTNGLKDRCICTWAKGGSAWFLWRDGTAGEAASQAAKNLAEVGPADWNEYRPEIRPEPKPAPDVAIKAAVEQLRDAMTLMLAVLNDISA